MNVHHAIFYLMNGERKKPIFCCIYTHDKFFVNNYYRYESSGYDDTSFRKYSSSPYRPTLYSSHSPNMSGQESETQQQAQQQQQQQQHEIVCGPSFNESLERFRSATGSGTESDGGGPGGNYKQSTFN